MVSEALLLVRARDLWELFLEDSSLSRRSLTSLVSLVSFLPFFLFSKTRWASKFLRTLSGWASRDFLR